MFSLCSVMILWIDENVIKCDFTEISQKMDQLHKSRKSSEMVARGWYRTHFDRRDFLKTKKIGLGWFCNFSDLYVLICDISRFFRKFRLERLMGGQNIFPTYDSEIFFQKLIFIKSFFFGETMILQLHFGIFTFGILPFNQKCQVFESLVVGFFLESV